MPGQCAPRAFWQASQLKAPTRNKFTNKDDPRRNLPVIKLIRTDTTLDLSQKAEKVILPEEKHEFEGDEPKGTRMGHEQIPHRPCTFPDQALPDQIQVAYASGATGKISGACRGRIFSNERS